MSENVTLKVYFDHEEAVLSLVRLSFLIIKQQFQTFPVLYRDFLREVRTTFQIEQSAQLIIHYESDCSVRRPLTGSDDFDLLLQLRFQSTLIFLVETLKNL